MPHFDLLLAQSSGTGPGIIQFLVYAVFIVIFISTMIKNIIKENKKKARRRQGNAGAGDGGGGTLEEVSARRRAQLQEIARQRQGGSGPSGREAQAFVGDDTANLSMADRIARARAANQANPPARGGSPSPSRGATPRATPVAGASAQQQRSVALRQRMAQREQQRRDALATRQPQASQANARGPASQARPQPPQRQSPASSRRPLPPVQTPHPVSVDPHREVHRMVADADAPVAKSSRRHVSASVEAERAAKANRSGPARSSGAILNFDKLSLADLRRAFILKEVLDRPISERDPLGK